MGNMAVERYLIIDVAVEMTLNMAVLRDLRNEAVEGNI